MGNDAFVDPGAKCSDSQGSLTVSTNCNVDTAVADEYFCDYTAVNNDGSKTVRRLVEVTDPNQPVETCLTRAPAQATTLTPDVPPQVAATACAPSAPVIRPTSALPGIPGA